VLVNTNQNMRVVREEIFGPVVVAQPFDDLDGINCYNVFDAALPFGGYKQSGWGREMGHAVLESYTEIKSVRIGL
jgi:phenylacetaldehyde dehydrogenase